MSSKTKPIPYPKGAHLQQTVHQHENQDNLIPEQHSSRNLKTQQSIVDCQQKTTKQNKNPLSTKHKLTNFKQANYFNKTYSSNSIKTVMETANVSSKKLTHGMTSYKDIKLSHHLHMSGSREKFVNQSRSGSKSKATLRLNDEYINSVDRQSAECTFTPKTNTGQTYKNFKDFVDFQQSFLTKREEKIKRMKKQIEEKQSAEITLAPKIDKKSRKMSQSAEQFQLDKNGSLKKVNKKAIHERLYNLPRKKDRAFQDQQSFTPKILNKSKSMIRNDKVQNLLYEDAQRRIEQQKLQQSSIYKKQQLLSKYPPLTNSLKQSKHNNKLICKKIRSQFLQLLQTQWDDQTMNTISPILTLTILSQIFNVELNPNKNQELCFFILNLLIQDKSINEDKGERYVETKKLWDFIKAIVVGIDSSQNGGSCFTQEQVRNIHQQLGYFYSLRLSKCPNKADQYNQQDQFQIQTTVKTKKMAEAHRARKLQQISEFISQTNAVQIYSNTLVSAESGDKTIEQKVITLQDLFILDSIRKKSQNYKKKMLIQEQQMKKCTFRPSLNQKSIKKAFQRKAKSRQNLKTVVECKHEHMQEQKQVQNKQNDQKCKKIVIKSKKNQKRESLCDKSRPQQQNSTCINIKNVDKTLLRLNLARKVRDVENAHKQRGYGSRNSQNWLEQVKQQKKQVLDQVSNFLGYKQNIQTKGQSKQKQRRQSYQSCQIK